MLAVTIQAAHSPRTAFGRISLPATPWSAAPKGVM
jgi:hypothetical protein